MEEQISTTQQPWPWEVRDKELDQLAQEMFALLQGCSFLEAECVWGKCRDIIKNTPMHSLLSTEKS